MPAQPRLLTGCFAVLLAACGGGGGGSSTAPPPESSGVLQAGRLTGVAWRTATRSGTTNSSGTFRYLPGETVTFSIDGLELGSTAGAAQVSLFTLAGGSPPANELALRREIAHLQSSPAPSSFQRALNLSMLMLSLDADNDPSNGLDVTRGNTALAGAQLSLDGGTPSFVDRLSRLTPDLNRNIPVPRAIGFLFSSLGLQISAGAVIRQGSTSHGSGFTSDIATTYDANGDVVTTTADLGRLFGTTPSSTTITRDRMGRITRQVTDYDNRIPGARFSHVAEATLDARGNRLRFVESDYFGATLASSSTTDATFDDHGRMLTRRFVFSVPGGLDSGERSEWTWDARGNLLHQRIAVDFDGNGQPENVYDDTFTFDTGNRLLTATHARDDGGDGVVDIVYVNTYSWDASGRPTTYVSTQDFGADGQVDERTTTIYTLDTRGIITRTIEDHEAPAGTPDERSDVVYTYDADVRTTSIVRRTDRGVDGVVDAIHTQSWTYDSNGFLTDASLAMDEQADGVTDYTGRQVSTYDANGARLSFTDQYDIDADGVPETSTAATWEYAPVQNGVVPLGYQYFPVGLPGGYASN